LIGKLLVLALLGGFHSLSLGGKSTIDGLPTLPYVLDSRVDYRLCGEAPRDSNNVIVRSSSVLAAYKRLHPCPVTGSSTGACKGWAVDHIIPLASGGCDSVINMAWMPVQIKSCKADWCKDRWERTYYGKPGEAHGIVDAIE